MSNVPILLQIDVPFCKCGSMIGILHKSFWFSWFPVPSWSWSNFCWFTAEDQTSGWHRIFIKVMMSFRFYVRFVIFLTLCFIIFPLLHQLWRDMWNIMVYYLFPRWFDFCCIFAICSVLTLRLSSSSLWVIFWTLVKLVGYYRMEASYTKTVISLLN